MIQQGTGLCTTSGDSAVETEQGAAKDVDMGDSASGKVPHETGKKIRCRPQRRYRQVIEASLQFRRWAETRARERS